MEKELNRIDKYRKYLFELQEKAVRFEAEEGMTEEQIQTRCAELKNKIIDAESINNRFRNPALHRIWNSPPRSRKFY